MAYREAAGPRRRIGRRWIVVVLAALLMPVVLYVPALVWDFTRPDPVAGPGSGPASTRDQPWVVIIGNPGAYPEVPSHKICVGALVSPRAVVTAGHCLGRRVPTDLTVTAGRDDLRGDAGRTVAVAETWVAPGFVDGVAQETFFGGLVGDYHSTSGDIGVVMLAEALPYEPVALSSPVEDPAVADAVAQRFGWRLSPQDEPVLWQAPVPVLEDVDCVDRAARAVRFMPPRLHGATYDQASYLCAGVGAQAVPFRASDSGSPLVVDGRLVGVAAWSPGGNPSLPDYYSRVSTYHDAITRVVDTAGR